MSLCGLNTVHSVIQSLCTHDGIGIDYHFELSRAKFESIIYDVLSAIPKWIESTMKALQPVTGKASRSVVTVLVDGSPQVTYVAQGNLASDKAREPVVHPMLNLFFHGRDEDANRYLRNDVPWDPGKPPDAPPPPPPAATAPAAANPVL